MRRSVAVVLVVCLATGIAGCSVDVDVQGPGSTPNSYNVTVTHVVDGDTLDVRYANGTTETVRLVGIDTPEVHVETEPGDWEGIPKTEAGHQCLRSAGENASTYVTELVADRQVRLELDAVGDTRGSYGRLLAYVFVDGDSLNYRLVADGYAAVYPSEFEQRERFESAEADAIAARAGAWRCQRLG